MSKAISLLIPCYNAAAFLPGLFDRINRQTTPFNEVIVYDDHSSDKSAELAGRFGARVLRGSRTRGPGFARNRLLEAATSPWVHYHDADDWLSSRFVERMSDALLSPDHGAACALRVVYLDGSEPDSVLRFPEVATTDNLVALMIRQFIHLDALVFPKHLIKAAGGFVDQMRFSEDRDLLARIAETSVRFGYIDEPLATWTKHARSLTRSRPTLAQAPYRRWYLHRCYHKLSRRHRKTIGNQALYVAWMFYFDAAGPEADAYRREARRWIYLARLCNQRYESCRSLPERLVGRFLGPEVVFRARRWYAKRRARLLAAGG
ncbi:MAG: glycosyltransferase family 2 protein [Verrucomicrobia bacterium]|nr:glycosyltransferase family 2 protein [Verrucomicrobiota bacterium]